MKRGTDYSWELVKYKDDLAIYARCKCKFKYSCSKNKRNEDGTWSFEHIPYLFYPYCPSCGARKKHRATEIIDGGFLYDNHRNLS